MTAATMRQQLHEAEAVNLERALRIAESHRIVLKDQLEAAMKALAFLGDPYARVALRTIRKHLAEAGIEVNA